MKKLLATIAIASALAINTQTHAADSGGAGSDGGGGYGQTDIKDSMSKARSLIGKSEYKRAIRELRAIIRADYRNADAWNLAGYSNRKLGKYKKAGKAYRKALKFNPQHKGALEYQGQLFITLNKLDKARANRDQLAMLCPDGCTELNKLNTALAAVN